jgi:hypothetical protein
MPDAPASEEFPEKPLEKLPVLVLCRDLIFATKISGTAQALGVRVKMIRDPAKLGNEPGARLIADLNLDQAIHAAAAWREATGGQVVAFVSHADAETIERARPAGIDRIMARSQFVLSLPDLLRS